MIIKKWVVATLKVWREVCRNQKLYEDLIFLKEMRTDQDFPPHKLNKDDHMFKLWASKGLRTFGQMFGDKDVKSFEQRSLQYDLLK